MKKTALITTLCFVLLFIPSLYASNDTTGATWVLDTTGEVWTETIGIVWIIWTDIATDGDNLAIHDAQGGSTIVQLKGRQGVDMIVPFPGNSGLIPGFYLTTLDSGTVQVRIGKY